MKYFFSLLFALSIIGCAKSPTLETLPVEETRRARQAPVSDLNNDQFTEGFVRLFWDWRAAEFNVQMLSSDNEINPDINVSFFGMFEETLGEFDFYITYPITDLYGPYYDHFVNIGQGGSEECFYTGNACQNIIDYSFWLDQNIEYLSVVITLDANQVQCLQDHPTKGFLIPSVWEIF